MKPNYGIAAFAAGAVGLATFAIWKRRNMHAGAAATRPASDSSAMSGPIDGTIRGEKEGKPDKRSSLEGILSVLSIKDVLVPTVFLGALGYFLGWRYLYSYYVGFGLDASLLSFSPTDVIAAGWRTYLGVVLVAIFAGFLWLLSQSLFDHLRQKGSNRLMLRAFFAFLILATCLAAYVAYQFFFVWGAHTTLLFYATTFACLSFLWLAFLAGDDIHRRLKATLPGQHAQRGLFGIVFPSPYIWIAVIALLLVVTLAFLSSYNGQRNSMRDRKDDGRLQIVSFYVDKELDISSGELVRPAVWLYKDLRFLYKTDKFFFVFRPAEIRDGIATLYAIPIEHVLSFEQKSWYDKFAHP